MQHICFYLPLQRVEDGFAFFAHGGVGSIPKELQCYPTLVVSTDPSNENQLNQLVAINKRGTKLNSQGKKETTRGRRPKNSRRVTLGSTEQQTPNTVNSDANSTIDDSEGDTYSGDNSKSSRALLEAQTVARRLVTLNKEPDNSLIQGYESTEQKNEVKDGLVVTENGAIFIKRTQQSILKPNSHVYEPMLSRVLTI